MSQEIINMLNYLSEQLGIVIDWTAENVWSQVMDILSRYRLLEIINNCLLVIGEIGMVIFAIIVFTKSAKGYSTIWGTGFGMALMIAAGFLGIISLISVPMEIIDTLKWIIIPEIKYLEILKGLMA